MNTDHEYALVGGINRSTVGRYIASIAAALSAVLVFLVLLFVDVATPLGISPNVPPSVFSLISAAGVYTGLYFLFCKYLWRWKFIADLIQLPDISGRWNCYAESSYSDDRHSDGTAWEAVVKISQTWDKIFITLTTEKSRSESVSAALIAEGNGNFRLLYHYKNDPRRFEDGLNAHHGFVDIIISEDLRSADGVYFTGRGRTTFGTMKWERHFDGAADRGPSS
jgi:hypothetical protein